MDIRQMDIRQADDGIKVIVTDSDRPDWPVAAIGYEVYALQGQ
jgi:hypothetical protein